MKKILSTLYIILACATPAIAQVKVSISELVGTKWQISTVYERHESAYYEFTKKEFIWHRDDGTTWPSSFYLSNTIPEKFDSTKVGVSTSGCYFNKYINKDHFTCYAILSFDKSKGEMVLELKNEKFIGPDDPITFILIKK
ncbi:MAG: hypothetical protein IK075_11765 [Prevotella sp.]|nr:hypothetical protein [Prevotella sp.]